MALIKNLHLLEDDLRPGDLDKMEVAASAHQRYSSITFKVVELKPDKVIFQITQGKSAAGNYQNQKRLIEIVHETYDRFFPGRKVQVHAIPFVESPANVVTDKWVNEKMLEKGIKLKQISEETGIDKTQLSSLITGDRPLSQPMKALFWYYFQYKAHQ